MKHADIVIEGGNLSAIYEDLEAVLGSDVAKLDDIADVSTRRASHVEPCHAGWTADMTPVGGPVLGPVPLRRDALLLERNYMDNKLWHTRKGV